jgi:hypothetical protein
MWWMLLMGVEGAVLGWELRKSYEILKDMR